MQSSVFGYKQGHIQTDIAYPCGHCIFETLGNPKLSNSNAVKRMFKYLKRTSGYRLHYLTRNVTERQLEVLSDADCAGGGDIKTRRSRTGMISRFTEGTLS